MKLVVIGDTHFGIKGFDKQFYLSQKRFFDFLLEDIKNKEVDAVIQLGDFFDNRKIIDVNFFQTLVNDFKEFLGKLKVPFYTFLGNHDIYYKNTNNVSLLHIFKELVPNFILIDKQTIIDNFAIVPWLLPEENIKEDLLNVNVIFGHFEFQGFEYLPGILSKNGRTPPKTEALIISGHYHVPSQRGNVIYTGTPYQLTWADTGSDRGYYVVDTDTKEFQFFKNDVSIKYVTIILGEDIVCHDTDPYDFDFLRKNKVRVILYEENSQNLSYLKKLSDVVDYKYIDRSQKYDVENINENIKLPSQILLDMVDDAKKQKVIMELIEEANKIVKE